MPTSPRSWSFQAISFIIFLGGSDVGCCRSEESAGNTGPKTEGCGLYLLVPTKQGEPAAIQTERRALFRLCRYAGNSLSTHCDCGWSGRDLGDFKPPQNECATGTGDAGTRDSRRGCHPSKG